MNVTDEELNSIYKVFTRFLKEIGCYGLLKNYPKSVIRKSLAKCSTGRGELVDQIWNKFNDIIYRVDDKFNRPRASLWYLFFILSDEFKNAYLRLFNHEGLKYLVRNERNYIRHNYNFGDKEEREKFIKSLNEIEANMYNTYIKPSVLEYGKL